MGGHGRPHSAHETADNEERGKTAVKDLGADDTLLERWRALAEVENARARKAWGFGGRTGWPDDPGAGSTLSPEVRLKRNRAVLAQRKAGRSIPEIGRLTGIANTTVWRILHGKTGEE